MRLAECMQTFHDLWFFFMSCCCSFHQENKPRYLFAFEENNQWDKTKLLPQGTGSRSTKENYCTSFELTAPTASLTCHTGTITTVLTLLDTITLRDRNLCTSPCTHVHVALDHQGSSLKHVCVFLYFPSHTAKSLQTFFMSEEEGAVQKENKSYSKLWYIVFSSNNVRDPNTDNILKRALIKDQLHQL